MPMKDNNAFMEKIFVMDRTTKQIIDLEINSNSIYLQAIRHAPHIAYFQFPEIFQTEGFFF